MASSITVAPADFPAIVLPGHDLRISPLSKPKRSSLNRVPGIWHILRHHRNISLVSGTITLRLFVPEPSTFVCMANSARSSLRRPCTLLRTELLRHRRPLLPLGPKPTGIRYPGAAFSIPRHPPIESDQSDEWWSCRRANPFRSSSPLAPIEAPLVVVNATGVPT
jgi:hypothetical protein